MQTKITFEISVEIILLGFQELLHFCIVKSEADITMQKMLFSLTLRELQWNVNLGRWNVH